MRLVDDDGVTMDAGVRVEDNAEPIVIEDDRLVGKHLTGRQIVAAVADVPLA